MTQKHTASKVRSIFYDFKMFRGTNPNPIFLAPESHSSADHLDFDTVFILLVKKWLRSFSESCTVNYSHEINVSQILETKIHVYVIDYFPL